MFITKHSKVSQKVEEYSDPSEVPFPVELTLYADLFSDGHIRLRIDRQGGAYILLQALEGIQNSDVLGEIVEKFRILKRIEDKQTAGYLQVWPDRPNEWLEFEGDHLG